MQKDFHYGVTKLLARVAGFAETEAQLIAYASQYTDDATKHRRIPIEGQNSKAVATKLDERAETWRETVVLAWPKVGAMEPVPVTSFIEGVHYFEPMCTATSIVQKIALQYALHGKIKSLFGAISRLINENTQSKVYIPFHFLPAQRVDHHQGGDQGFNFCVQAGGPFAMELMRTVSALCAEEQQGAERDLRLIALGIACHTFVDTWSHEGFSGRKDDKDNDVAALKTSEYDYEMDMDLSVAPEVGHAEAGHTTDQAHLGLRIEFCDDARHSFLGPKTDSGFHIARENSVHFITAARAVLEHLMVASGTAAEDLHPRWADIEDPLFRVLRTPTEAEDRIELLANTFGKHFDEPIEFDYAEDEWEMNTMRLEASSGTAADAQPLYQPEVVRIFDPSEHWIQFHIAAAAQRSVVRANIEKFW